jgi:chromate transporter
VFTGLALRGFGGVLPWAQRVLVEERRWLSREQFIETLAFGQLLPGPNVCNVAIMVGDRWFGWRGAVAALGGMLAAPMLLVLGAAVLYGQVADEPVVRRALAGMGGCPYAKGATGNVATEDLLYLFQGLGIETGVDLAKVVETGQWVSGLLGRRGQARAGNAIAAKRADAATASA